MLATDQPSPTDPTPRFKPPARDPIATVEGIALLVTIACGLAAWAVGIRTYGYDYDEVLRAHSVWLASQGLRPYDDFFEVHPPYFRLLVPAIRGGMEPLLALRIVTSVGNLLFLGALGTLGSALAGGGRRWAWLGLAVVAWHPDILAFLVEFRIDGWGYALATWSIVRHHRRTPGVARDFELGVTTGVATLLFCPKLTILPALVVACGAVRPWVSIRWVLRALSAYAAGVAVAVGLFLAWLAWQGIDTGRMVDLLMRYHVISGAGASFHRGLLGAILANRVLLGLILAGVLAWFVACVHRRAWPGTPEVALLAWLAVQGVLVAYPYKQYYAPWFLFASGYLGFLGQGSAAWLKRARLVPFLAACVATGFGATQAARGWSALGEAEAQQRLIRWMDRVAGPDDRVVTSPPLHPIDRLDTFFLWFNTADPAGFDSERILERLPAYRSSVAPARFTAELEAHPPAFVFLSGSWRVVGYPAGQQEALRQFLPRRGYRIVAVGPVQFAVRPDRLGQAE